ncbi:MAG: S8/S53 family peptidase [Bacteroidetes bacterium]|nr:S8/S53 family peptidase [Bacteroidota bacterium]
MKKQVAKKWLFLGLFLLFQCALSAEALYQPVNQDSTKKRLSFCSERIPLYTSYSDVRFSHFDEDITLSMDEIKKLSFNRLTMWNTVNKELSEKVLEFGAFNGNDIEELHNNGITGKGVNVAIIDQNLAGEHPEFQGKIAEYHDMGCNQPGTSGSMHGPAVTSILVGENLGTAPGAKVYYYAAPSWTGDGKYYADALLEIIEKNTELAPSEKIKVVSVSAAPGGKGSPFNKNLDLWQIAVEEAEKVDILILDCTFENSIIGPGYFELDKQKKIQHIVSGWPNNRQFHTQEGKVTVPSSYRTVAEEYLSGEYGYYYTATGGLSWSIPYAAGVCAMAWQINPNITSLQMKEIIFNTAYTTERNDRVINPKAIIRAAKEMINY